MFGKRAKTKDDEPEYYDEEPQLPAAVPRNGHKGMAGRVACLCGSAEMPGAALLVARAAQRAGAGLVAMGGLDARVLDLLPLAAPEAVLQLHGEGLMPTELWPGGEYWTDASGGEYGSVARLRRVGCGIARLDGGTDALEWGCFFALPGSKQTVPRGELHGILTVCLQVDPVVAVVVFTDSKLNADIFN